MGGRGTAGKAATAKRERRGLAHARNHISNMKAEGNYSREGAIKETMKSMKTSRKQAEKYVSRALS